jgi:hypothetical protein
LGQHQHGQKRDCGSKAIADCCLHPIHPASRAMISAGPVTVSISLTKRFFVVSLHRRPRRRGPITADAGRCTPLRPRPSQNTALWLWVPAFAGTTASFGPHFSIHAKPVTNIRLASWSNPTLPETS